MTFGMRIGGPMARCVASLLLAACASAALAGPLNPPAGPVAPTGRSLDRIEPRVCLNDLPGSPVATHVITAPGQYFLSADVQGEEGKHGILIESPGDVSIDLNGFALRGAPDSQSGVHYSGGGGGGRVAIFSNPPKRPPASQAMITNFGGPGISCDGASSLTCSGLHIRSCGGDGVYCGSTSHVVCEDLDIEACGAYAVRSLHATNIVHRDIAARICLQGGIHAGHGGGGGGGAVYVYVRLSSCAIASCGGNGATIECPEDGFDVDVSSSSFGGCSSHGLCINAAAAPGGGLGTGKVSMSDLSCVRNGGNGVDVGRSPGSPITCRCDHLICVGNSGDGMYFRMTQPGQPQYGNICFVANSDFSSNGGSGLRSENPLYAEKTTTGSNALYGVRVSGTDPLALMGHMVSCVSTANGAACMSCGPGRFANVDCTISDGLSDGIELTDGCLLLTNTTVNRCAGNGLTVSGSLNVQGGSLRRNGGYGVVCYNGTCSASELVCELNGADAASGTPGGGALFVDCPSIGLERCEFSNNNGDGVKCSSTVGPIKWMSPECMARNNTGSGFDLANCVGFELVGCVATGNGSFGITGRGTVATGRIERCSATGNGGGISLAGTGCLVVNNSASSGPLGAIVVGQGNVVGPIIDVAGVATSCNPRANVVY